MLTYALPDLKKTAPPAAACVALGFFDGVHLAHEGVLAAARRTADLFGLPLLVYTFRGGDTPKGDVPLLCDDAERMRLFAARGVDYCVMDDFSAVRKTSPEAFVQEILRDTLNAEVAVVGSDFRFGYRAEGDAEMLSRLMRGRTRVVLPVTWGGAPISSTRIRAAIAKGDMPTANALLGRPYALTGPVIHGEARGRKFGFPTANQALPKGRAVPKDGVYVTEAVTEDGRTYRAVTDIGLRPTVGGRERRAETHLIDFSEDLYGRALTVRYLARLRDEVALPSTEALVEQIKKDTKEATEWKP